ncbi:ABC transporter ATP-binding protein [Mangrovihabitans endophyticus]|uniref:ABC transporter ATP-binding protein n=1 Tax=Mangrovihabitans endophyticus TaxID=1751298 RepID=A0A8J3BU42_9ACTN|nr:ABC transporter ATP-binding protein [Mangrovihabitans endophyticus]GGK74744.1 ABC transporter ATP-binding protein [Mangrovihabitans endophyticus]
MRNAAPLLAVHDLHVDFDTPAGPVAAVSGVSFEIEPNETVALVGESGSGKSVTALAMMRLLGRGATLRGQITCDGRDITGLTEKQMRSVRGRAMTMIFQDPMSSLDPLYSVGNQLVETVRLHNRMSRARAVERATELLDQVGIADPRGRLRAYPHQLSGGQRQRVMIALALACSPRLLIADEPTTALDVTIEAQILELIRGLQREYRMSLLLVTHDMAVVAEMADRVVVMYAGQVVESGAAEQILRQPQHPYTTALFQCIPTPVTDRSAALTAIPGAVPSPHELPPGCRFHPRCAVAFDRCVTGQVPLFPLDGGARHSRCWLSGDAASGRADRTVVTSASVPGPARRRR